MEWLFSEAWWFPEKRLDFLGLGPGTENRSGALIAQVVVSAWWFALVWRRWGIWLSLALSAAAMVLLLQTQSRGALVAVAIAAMIGLWQAFRYAKRGSLFRSNLISWIGCFLVLGALAVYAWQLGVGTRIGRSMGGLDGSTLVRLDVYQAGLRMLVDGPWGWGNAADAYSQWYQDVGASRWYLSLLNSHLTWMNQYGWWFGLPYVAGWVAVFVLLWSQNRDCDRKISHRGTEGMEPSIRHSSLALQHSALTVWVVLWVTACFSHVLSWWGMWVIPAAWLLASFVGRIRNRDWPTMQQWRCAGWAACTIIVVLAVSGWGLGVNQPKIHGSKDRVVMEGEGELRVVIYGVDRRVLGDRYGHTLREWLPDWKRVEVWMKPEYCGETPDVLLIAGSSLPDNLTKLPAAGQTVLLNPAFREDWGMLLEGHQVRVIMGGMGDWRRRMAWEEIVEQHSDWEWIRLGWAGDFIPDWGKYTLSSQEDEDMELEEE